MSDTLKYPGYICYAYCTHEIQIIKLEKETSVYCKSNCVKFCLDHSFNVFAIYLV